MTDNQSLSVTSSTTLPGLDAETRKWLEKTECPFENGKPILTPLMAAGGTYTSCTLAPKPAIEYLTKEITEGRYKSLTKTVGWVKRDAYNQLRFHDPSADHIQKLFRLFETKTDRTLTIEEILKEIGGDRHCKTDKHTNMLNEHYWKCILRELYKQRIVIRNY